MFECSERGDFGVPMLVVLPLAALILAKEEANEFFDAFSSYELVGVLPRISNDMSSCSDILGKALYGEHTNIMFLF